MDALGAVIGQQFCSPDEIHLAVARKVVAVSGANFVVADDKRNVIFTLKEKLLSLHGRRVLADAQGNIIVTSKKKILRAHRRWQLFKGDSSDPDDLLFLHSSNLRLNWTISGGNKEENSCDFKVVRSWSERSCGII